jgi:hypothetical protein
VTSFISASVTIQKQVAQICGARYSAPGSPGETSGCEHEGIEIPKAPQHDQIALSRPFYQLVNFKIKPYLSRNDRAGVRSPA